MAHSTRRYAQFITILLAVPWFALADDHRVIAEEPGDFFSEQLTWMPSTTLPPGAEVAVVAGDPARPGPFTVRVRLPGGFVVPPHRHPADERLTVLAGSIHLGQGPTFDRIESIRLRATDSAVNSAGKPHFSWTDEPATIQITATGPWAVTYVRATDDPRDTADNASDAERRATNPEQQP